MKRWLPIGLVAAGVALAVYATFFWSSDEDRIRARLDQLAAAVRVGGGENPVFRQARLRGDFAEIFTKDARARVAEVAEGLQGRDALVGAATQLAGPYQTADVSLGGVGVRIDRAGVTAEVDATATLTGVMHGQPPRRDERKVTFQLEKIDGDWMIVSATVAARAEDDSEL